MFLRTIIHGFRKFLYYCNIIGIITLFISTSTISRSVFVHSFSNDHEGSLLIPSISITFAPDEQLGVTSAPTFVSTATFPTAEYDALYDLYNTCNGENWVWNVTFQQDTIPWNFSTTTQNPCVERWQGVYCSCNSTVENDSINSTTITNCTTIGLVLHYHNLTGSLPSTLNQLSNLQTLDFSNNDLTGPLPSSISEIQSLETIALIDNSITSTIPPAYANLTKLLVFEVSINQIYGSIPDFIGRQWYRLRQLGLSNNSMTGEIPVSLSQLHQLERLTIAGNNFTGTIPTEYITAFANLKTFDIARNQFTGPLPLFSASYMPLLGKLALQQNMFTGTIPLEYGYFNHLRYLQISQNHLTGEIPTSFQYLKNLTVFSCFSNRLNGTVDVLFTSNTSISFIAIANNLFTGLAFPNNGEYFNATIQYLAYKNYLEGTIPENPAIFHHLLYLDIGGNMMYGTLPRIIENATRLHYLYVDQNMFSGSIPQYLGLRNPFLEVVYVNNNTLTGTIPSSLFSKLKFICNASFPVEEVNICDKLLEFNLLKEFKCGNNRLTGTIPTSVAASEDLTMFIAYNNKLTGTIPQFNASWQTMLQTLDVASNRLTGTIPNSIYTLPALQTLIIGDNCLTGTISKNVCHAKQLINIVLNGFGTADACQKKIFPGIPYLTSFAELRGTLGTLPSCLFELPSLTAMYLSGINLVSTIPSSIEATTTLKDISLSDNILTGTIPLWMQERAWNVLDLSNNKLGGTLSSNIHAVASDAYLALDVNRISGKIPRALDSAKNLSILAGNLYTCGIGKSELPQHDSYRGRYSCGSQTINFAMFFWAFSLLGYTIVMVILFQWFYKYFLINTKNNEIVTTSGNSSYHPQFLRAFRYVKNIVEVTIRNWTVINAQRGIRKSNPIRRLIFFFSAVRFVFVAIMLFIIIVLMPMYGILSVFYSMYELTYAWSISAIYLSGICPSVLLTLGFAGSIVLLFYLFQKKVYPFSARLKQDKINHRMTLAKTNAFDNDGDNDICTNIMERNSFADQEYSKGFSNLDADIVTDVVQSKINTNSESYHKGESDQSLKESDNDGDSRSATQHNRLSFVSSVSSLAETGCSVYSWSIVALALINFFVMILVDVIYVKFILEANTKVTIVMQIALSALKVQWNEYILWILYPIIKIRLSSVMECIQCQGSSNSSINDHKNPCSSPCICWNCFSVFKKARQYQFTTKEINFMALTIIFNNVVIPSIAIAVVSSRCLYNAFFADSPSQQVTVYSCGFYTFLPQAADQQSCVVYVPSSYETTYHAPFIYHYECSGTFSIKFVAVYVFMLMIVGGVIPLFNMCMYCLYYAYKPSTQSTSEHGQTCCGRLLFQLADFSLSMRWKPLVPNPPEHVTAFRLLDNDRLIVRLNSCLAILLAFGVLFPPLAVVAVLSIYSITYFEQYAISRLLVEAKALGYTWYEEKIVKECEHIAESWFDTLKILLPFASFSYAFVVFDTLGDQYGWKAAIGPTLFIALLPVWFYLWRKLRPKDDLEDGSSDDFVYEDIFYSFIERFWRSTTVETSDSQRDSQIITSTATKVQRSSLIEMRPSSFMGGSEGSTVHNPVHN